MEPGNLLMKLAEAAEQDGWRSAALNLLAPYPDLLRYVGDERSGDWRFLLPELPKGDFLCLGGALSPVPLSLARTCRNVTVVCSLPQSRFLLARAREQGFSNISVVSSGVPNTGYDLVAVLRSPMKTGAWRRQNLSTLAEEVSSNGWLYMEVDNPAFVTPQVLVKARLERAGFSEVAFYWPKPTFQLGELLMPLGDRRLQNYYIDYQFYAMSPARRVLRFGLKMLIKTGLFDLTVPVYSVLARHGAGAGYL